MTRINTNVSSLVAQNRLQSSNKDLNSALTRLSTGLRINSGADDPAGLIASEALRSEITGLNKSITNTQRASQIISTADSALGQVSNLLNDVRGLVVEAANSGALSADEIEANQLQIDSSLEAINRIAQTTTFQGRKLLDGSLGFQTKAGTNFGNVKDLQVDQANLGSTDKVDVSVTISKAAEQASVSLANIPAGITAESATGDLTFTSQTAAAASTVDFTLGTESFTLTADADGVAGDDLSVVVANTGASGTSPVVSKTGDEYTITLASDSTATADDIALAFNTFVDANDDDVTLTTTGGTTDVGAATLASTSLAGGADIGAATTATINLTAKEGGTASNITSIAYAEVSGTTPPTAAFDSGTGVLTVTVDDASSVTLDSIVDAINAGDDFSAAVEAGGDFTSFDPTISAGAGSNFVDGIDAGGGLAEAAVFELQGASGSEVFNVSKGTTIDELVSQINLVSDATGVKAEADGTTLNLTSTAYGSAAIVDINVISEASTGTLTAAVGAGKRTTGSDIQAKVNGIDASGKGNSLKINTSTLDLSLTVNEGSNENITFTINGGGAKFQLGSDVVGNQQARIGINSVNTARLGGTAGKLFELGSGGSAALSKDPSKAAKIVTEAIGQVTGLRGRLGAFQATTLDSNLISLNETKANLQEAESSIRDADFAQESAKLTRAQILVQSGTNVLSLANQNPQNVLSLLR
ncbi:B-type flagellin [Rubripirellula tenax]|uniref:Flagellin n=1 Tax=Rubripirellula tenax TaxID=2528015 RepID=A0A5C6ECL4_9BACT|nr:flagellin [Rubripirellula tenax]TWU46225.1 B-type flagellin [Rubripirellula tenax]